MRVSCLETQSKESRHIFHKLHGIITSVAHTAFARLARQQNFRTLTLRLDRTSSLSIPNTQPKQLSKSFKPTSKRMSGPTETVAFFGGTGGCALATLTRTLNAGHNVSALARTPSKLTDLLKTKGVSEDTINKHLTVTEGNAKDQAAVEKTLMAPGSADRLVDVVISGLGGKPTMQMNPRTPVTTDDPTICGDATETLLNALRSLVAKLNIASDASKKPLVLVISTTGIGDHRDIPVAMVPLYHWLLAVPHEDKRKMERLLDEASKAPEVDKPLHGAIMIRPSLLVDGNGKGLDHVREGWETHGSDVGKPAIGYTIARDDVGAWIFAKIVENKQRSQWFDRRVTLTT